MRYIFEVEICPNRKGGSLAIFEVPEIRCRVCFWFKVLGTIFEVTE